MPMARPTVTIAVLGIRAMSAWTRVPTTPLKRMAVRIMPSKQVRVVVVVLMLMPILMVTARPTVMMTVLGMLRKLPLVLVDAGSPSQHVDMKPLLSI